MVLVKWYIVSLLVVLLKINPIKFKCIHNALTYQTNNIHSFHPLCLALHFIAGFTFRGAFFRIGKLSLHRRVVFPFSVLPNLQPAKRNEKNNTLPRPVKKVSNSVSESKASKWEVNFKSILVAT
jgi:hypothetical protein